MERQEAEELHLATFYSNGPGAQLLFGLPQREVGGSRSDSDKESAGSWKGSDGSYQEPRSLGLEERAEELSLATFHNLGPSSNSNCHLTEDDASVQETARLRQQGQVLSVGSKVMCENHPTFGSKNYHFGTVQDLRQLQVLVKWDTTSETSWVGRQYLKNMDNPVGEMPSSLPRRSPDRCGRAQAQPARSPD